MTFSFKKTHAHTKKNTFKINWKIFFATISHVSQNKVCSVVLRCRSSTDIYIYIYILTQLDIYLYTILAPVHVINEFTMSLLMCLRGGLPVLWRVSSICILQDATCRDLKLMTELKNLYNLCLPYSALQKSPSPITHIKWESTFNQTKTFINRVEIMQAESFHPFPFQQFCRCKTISMGPHNTKTFWTRFVLFDFLRVVYLTEKTKS